MKPSAPNAIYLVIGLLTAALVGCASWQPPPPPGIGPLVAPRTSLPAPVVSQVGGRIVAPAGPGETIVRGQNPAAGGGLVTTSPPAGTAARQSYQNPPAHGAYAATGTSANAPTVYQTGGQYYREDAPGLERTTFAPPPTPEVIPGRPVLFPNGIPDDFVNPFPGPPPGPDPDNPIPLDVIVEETMTGRLMFGVGVNSDAGLTGQVVVDEQNFDWRRFPRSFEDFRNGTAFRGGGQRLRLEALPGNFLQRYSADFQEPYLFDTRVSMGLSGYYFQRQYFDWSEQRAGGQVALGYNLTPDLSASTTFRGARVTLYDPRVDPPPPDLAEALGDNELYGFGVRLTHDTRDSAFLATEGHFIQLGVEEVIGSFDYPRVDLDGRKYFLIHERPDRSGRHVLSVSGRIGVAGSDTPVYDRYFAGGFSTIRGFAFRGASPKQDGVIVGGQFQLLGSVEYMFPLMANDVVNAVVFTDFGTVERNSRLYADNFRVAPGLGLRISLPALGPAPIALDFAWPVAKAPGDEERVFSFYIGINR